MAGMKMLHEVDPRDEIYKEMGNLDGFEVFPAQILVAIYKRPEKTKGGVILTPDTRKEDIYQGKVALVLKVGVGCFVDDDRFKFYGMSAKPGDWLVLRASDGWAVEVRGRECRMVPDLQVKMRIAEPDSVW